MTDLLDQGAAAIASAIGAGRTSARDVAETAIARVEARNKAITGHAVFTPLFNLALVPGISVPCGKGRDGLPVGQQIVAPRLHDRPLLAMAQRAEAALA